MERFLKSLKVGIICNIQSSDSAFSVKDEEAEFDSPATVEAIRDALIAHGVDAVIIEADKNLPEKIASSGINFAFNIAEGRGGRDREAQVPALLSLLNIPYSGSDALVMSVTLDKAICKRLAASAGIRTAQYTVIRPGEEDRLPPLKYPVIVKPNAEGSGKGITDNCIAENEAELIKMLKDLFLSYPQDMIVEAFLPGREFTVGILGNGKTLEVFPPMEIIYRHPTHGDYYVYSYEIKKNYTRHVDYVCPADLPDSVSKEIVNAAGTMFELLGCCDLARVDFRMDGDGIPYFLEINPLPGLTPNYSDYPMTAEAAGYSYNDLIYAIFKAAAVRLCPSSREE